PFAALERIERGERVGQANRFDDSCPGGESHRLWQVRDAPAAVERPAGRVQITDEDFQQRRLPDPVRPDQTGAHGAETESQRSEKAGAVGQAIAKVNRTQVVWHNTKLTRTKE